jgi:hypothetical protein
VPKIGDRVTVQIAFASDYAPGAASSLANKAGVVTDVREGYWAGYLHRSPGTTGFFVQFDEPARPWATNQRPVAGFWFEEGGLHAE